MPKGKRRLSTTEKTPDEISKIRAQRERENGEDLMLDTNMQVTKDTESNEADDGDSSTSFSEEEVEEIVEDTDGEDAEQKSTVARLKDGDGLKEDKFRLFRPTVDVLGDGEELVVDEEYYEINRKFGLGDPCISFDIVPDTLGVVRHKGPHTVYLVGGTQAEQRRNNGLIVTKLSNIRKTFIDEDMTDSDSEEDEDEHSGDPKFTSQKILLGAEVNIVRVCPHNNWLVAAFLDDSNVQIHAIRDHLQVLDDPTKYCNPHQKALYTFTDHTAEGFALAWSPTQEGNLLTGSRDTTIRLLQPVESGFTAGRVFHGHNKGVEGLSWKVDDVNVFASASADHTIRLWDQRQSDAASVCSEAHKGDVNVVCFHRLEDPYQLLSGGDDGWTKVRDIRMLSQALACYDWHKQPICAVDWHPTDGSMYLSAGYDDQLTIWSLDVEAERLSEDETMTEFPDQLMFQHLGLKDVTTARWHPQIPGLIICNGSSEFSIFKPIKAVFGHFGDDN